MLLYYITDRAQFPGDEASRRAQLLNKITEATRAGIDFIQVREKGLPSRELETLAREALQAIRQISRVTRNSKLATKLLINSRSDIALAVGADGVQLRSDDISVTDARAMASTVLSRNSTPETRNWLIGVSCHSDEEVGRAAAEHANFVVFAPVFEKREAPGTTASGLAALRDACRHDIPVLALGGVTTENAASCLAAGAAGIAGIRLFQQNDISDIVRRLRGQ